MVLMIIGCSTCGTEGLKYSLSKHLPLKHCDKCNKYEHPTDESSFCSKDCLVEWIEEEEEK